MRFSVPKPVAVSELPDYVAGVGPKRSHPGVRANLPIVAAIWRLRPPVCTPVYAAMTKSAPLRERVDTRRLAWILRGRFKLVIETLESGDGCEHIRNVDAKIKATGLEVRTSFRDRSIGTDERPDHAEHIQKGYLTVGRAGWFGGEVHHRIAPQGRGHFQRLGIAGFASRVDHDPPSYYDALLEVSERSKDLDEAATSLIDFAGPCLFKIARMRPNHCWVKLCEYCETSPEKTASIWPTVCACSGIA